MQTIIRKLLDGSLWLLIVVTSLLRPNFVQAQDVRIEWFEFDCNTEKCLVLNAYLSQDADSSIDEYQSPQLNTEEVAAVFLTVPPATVPPPSALNPFLELLGVRQLSELADQSSHLASEAPGSSGFALWSALVRAVHNEQDFSVGNRRVHSRQVSFRLRQAYALQGYPSPDAPVFPHLVRGVVALVDSDTGVVDSTRTLNIGALDYGATSYTPLAFENLGSRAARVYAAWNPTTSASLSDGTLVLEPGAQVSELLRIEGGILSSIVERPHASIAYESEGTERTVVRLKARHSSSAMNRLVAIALTYWDKHGEYQRELRLYRFASAAVLFGLFILLLAGARRGVGYFRSAFRDLNLQVGNTFKRMRAWRPQLSLKKMSVGSSGSSVSLGEEPVAESRRLAPALASSQARMTPGRLRTLFDTSVGALRSSLASVATVPFQPVVRDDTLSEVALDARSCVDRIHQYSVASIKSIEADGPPPATSAQLRREVRRLIDRYDSALASAELAPTVENFQMLWALRLLASALKTSEESEHQHLLQQWLSGAEKVIAGENQGSVGPTNWEFLELARTLDESRSEL